MKSAVLGGLVVAGIWAAVQLVQSSVQTVSAQHAQQPMVAHAANPGLIALTQQLTGDRQQVTLIDPYMRVLSVYHIEPTSGQVVLKSVRSVSGDLQMSEFNAAAPLPHEIRSLIQNPDR